MVEAATITLDHSVSTGVSSAIPANFNQSTDAQWVAIRPILAATVVQMLTRTETALRGGAKLVSWEEGSGTVLEEDKPQALERAAALAKQAIAPSKTGFHYCARPAQACRRSPTTRGGSSADKITSPTTQVSC